VFAAFIDPQITSQFWFTRGSAPLVPGTTVQWTWEMYGFTVDVTVKQVEPNRRIVVEWPPYGTPTTIEWTFTPLGGDGTFVSITNAGFRGTGDEVVKQALEIRPKVLPSSWRERRRCWSMA
jgi:uncharacterized protein YndB with AHSA1/START domain